jgi:hypothetical protein
MIRETIPADESEVVVDHIVEAFLRDARIVNFLQSIQDADHSCPLFSNGYACRLDGRSYHQKLDGRGKMLSGGNCKADGRAGFIVEVADVRMPIQFLHQPPNQYCVRLCLHEFLPSRVAREVTSCGPKEAVD